MAKFAVVKKTCLSCKSVVDSGALCKACRPKTKQIYVERKLD